MFIGHLAVALGAKQAEPRVPLAMWLVAAFGLDVLWPLLLMAGLETVRIDPGNTAFTPLDFVSYPWSHSLLMSVAWGALAAVVATRLWPGARAGLLVAAVVVSHWVLDFVSHRPDLPLWPGSARYGLGLWNSVPATLVVEGALFAVALAAYVRAFPARDAIGRWALVALIAFVTFAWVSGPFSPPPPSVNAIVAVSIALVPLLAVMAIWIERHRGRR